MTCVLDGSYTVMHGVLIIAQIYTAPVCHRISLAYNQCLPYAIVKIRTLLYECYGNKLFAC